MLMTEWNWDDALAVRYEEGREEERKEWQGVVADKDAEITDLAAEIARLREQLANSC